MKHPSALNKYPTKTAAALIAVALIAGCGSGDPLPAEVEGFAPSAGGRLDVAIRVTNDSDSYQSPQCTVRAFDADGFRKGSDLVEGGVLASGGSDLYRGTVGINAEGVTSVEVECRTGS